MKKIQIEVEITGASEIINHPWYVNEPQIKNDFCSENLENLVFQVRSGNLTTAYSPKKLNYSTKPGNRCQMQILQYEFTLTALETDQAITDWSWVLNTLISKIEELFWKIDVQKI